MDKRIVLTKRQKDLIKELKKNLKRLHEMDVDLLAYYEEEKLILAFYNDKDVNYYEGDVCIDEESEDENSCVLDPNKLSHVALPATDLGTDPMLLVENNQYVRDRILAGYKKIRKQKEQIALEQALGDDGERLQEIKDEIMDRAKADKELHKELEIWTISGNEKMIEITHEDITANNNKRAALKSEAIRLGRIVAQKKRGFLKNKDE